jgi:hypothetical protein
MILKHCFQYRKFNELLKLKISSSGFAPAKPQRNLDSAQEGELDIFHLKEAPLSGEVEFTHFRGADSYKRY